MDTTGTKATGLQKFLTSTVILVLLALVVALMILLVWLMFRVNLLAYWQWVTGGGTICTLGMLGAKRFKKNHTATALPTGPEPGQNLVRDKTSDEGRTGTSEDGDEVRDGAS